MTVQRLHDRGVALIGAAMLSTAMLVTGCGGDEGGQGSARGGGMPPTPVEVASVQRQELVDRFDAVGSFEAVSSVAVVSEVSGIVRELPFEEGGAVKRGDLLARLEDSELTAALARAEAVNQQARNSYERVKRVVEQKAGSPQDLDDAFAALRVAEADVALARARLEKTRIRAPFAGYVGPRLVSPGAFLQPGQTITELTELDELEVVFSAPERYLPRLTGGSSIAVSTPAYPGVQVEGHITVVDPVVDEATRTVEVIGRVGNPGLRFRPGMSVDVAAVLSRKANALTVPAAAIFAQGAETLVYVVAADSTVQRTPVVLGTRLAAVVEILEGVEDGDRVVQAGHQKLFPGAKVMPIPAGGPAGAGGSQAPAGADTTEHSDEPTANAAPAGSDGEVTP